MKEKRRQTEAVVLAQVHGLLPGRGDSVVRVPLLLVLLVLIMVVMLA